MYNNFEKIFMKYMHHRIVLYGTGYISSEIIDNNNQFNIVGLLDRDPSRKGELYHGIRVQDIEWVKNNADIVIICAAKENWEIIYRRLVGVGLTVYYLNGEKASLSGKCNIQSNIVGYEEIKDKINDADIISFDFFDTLVTRIFMSPYDVWDYEDDNCNKIKNYGQLRKAAEINAGKGKENSAVHIDEIYANFPVVDFDLEQLKQYEISEEVRFSLPIKPLLELFMYCVDIKKDVYIISDMYLSSNVLLDILQLHGVNRFNKSHILVSSEVRRYKYTGSMWEWFKKSIVKDKCSLHIGDNIFSDYKMAKKSGIDAVLIPNITDRIENSICADLYFQCTNYVQSIVLKTIAYRLCGDPFQDSLMNMKEFGFCAIGPICFFLQVPIKTLLEPLKNMCSVNVIYDEKNIVIGVDEFIKVIEERLIGVNELAIRSDSNCDFAKKIFNHMLERYLKA